MSNLPGIRVAQLGLLINILLVLVKLASGIIGHTYALVADAAESSADILSSIIVWRGLTIAARPPDDDHPFGHGRAEPLAAAVVSLMLLVAALGIAIAAVREILTPHEIPHRFTLFVAAGVIAIKELLYRRVFQVGDEMDWAALVAASIIAVNGFLLLRPAIDDLMDRVPDGPVVELISNAATSVDGVLAIEKLKVRKLGTDYYVDLHVQADPSISLFDAHILSGKVKAAIRTAVPSVSGASIHMEPFEEHAGQPAA